MPSDSELLDMGYRFCREWKRAFRDSVLMDGPIFVARDMETRLSATENETLDSGLAICLRTLVPRGRGELTLGQSRWRTGEPRPPSWTTCARTPGPSYSRDNR